MICYTHRYPKKEPIDPKIYIGSPQTRPNTFKNALKVFPICGVLNM